MTNTATKKIAIIGCGNVAWHIAKKLNQEKNIELFVYNHKANKDLIQFKKEFNAEVFPSIKKIIPDADVYFVSVTDASIPSVIYTLSYLPTGSSVFITSGSFDLQTLKSKFKNLAVFYPLQTFSKNDEIKWKDITLVFDPANQTIDKKANTYARIFSKSVIKLNYPQRLKLHLSAVLVNNFTNSLIVEADKLVKSIHKNLDHKLLLPLIKQSAKKLKHITPLEAQTGPAKRKDKEVMQKHLSLLKNNKDLKELYQLFSNLIAKQQN